MGWVWPSTPLRAKLMVTLVSCLSLTPTCQIQRSFCPVAATNQTKSIKKMKPWRLTAMMSVFTNLSIPPVEFSRSDKMNSKEHKMSFAVVVVTFNRLNWLTSCLGALKGQTEKPDEIIVINNGSADGTTEYLATEPDVYSILQSNGGGAGGFARGLEVAFDRGHDWVWIMDDDCIAAPRSFESIKLVSEEIGISYPVFNSNVIKIDDVISRAQSCVAAGKRYQMSGASLFNGTVIGRKAYEEIGNVNKDLILWGDEVNYYMRARNKYGHVPVAVDSIVYHPVPYTAEEIPQWKQYFEVRNAVYNSLRFSRFGPIGVIPVLFQKGKRVLTGTIKIKLYLQATKAGLLGKLGWDNPYRA